MNYLSVQDLGTSYGVQTLFKGLNFGSDQGQKVALVARNGSGKTTILRALAGVEPADTGEIVYRKGIQVVFLKQESDFGDANTVFEAIYDSENPIILAIRAYEAALLNPDDTYAFQKAFYQMDRMEAWDYFSMNYRHFTYKKTIVPSSFGADDYCATIENIMNLSDPKEEKN